jgi:gliding motility-associated lipoprotein GldH
MKPYIFILLACLFFIQCASKNRLQQQILPLPMEWSKDQPLNFDMHVADTTLLYDIKISLRHHSNTLLTSVKAKMEVAPPEGAPYTREVEIFLKDEKGRLKGDAAGDITDFCCYKAEEALKLKKGTYHITLSQNSEKPVIPDIMGVGVELWKAEK